MLFDILCRCDISILRDAGYIVERRVTVRYCRAICYTSLLFLMRVRGIRDIPAHRLLVNRSGEPVRISRRWKSKCRRSVTHRYVISWLTRLHFPCLFFSFFFPFIFSYLAQAHRVPRKSRTYTEIGLGVTYDLCFNLGESSRLNTNRKIIEHNKKS